MTDEQLHAAILPELTWTPTTACGPRNGSRVRRVVVHRWGDRFTDEPAEARTYHGVIRYFQNRDNGASSHLVYGGSIGADNCTQMVRWSDYAWTEASYNPTSVEVESADLIWEGSDHAGALQLARIVAYLLHANGLPPVWSHDRGFCRHADLGAAGGGHTACPTTDIRQWRAFCSMVNAAHARGGFREKWGRV